MASETSPAITGNRRIWIANAVLLAANASIISVFLFHRWAGYPLFSSGFIVEKAALSFYLILLAACCALAMRRHSLAAAATLLNVSNLSVLLMLAVLNAALVRFPVLIPSSLGQFVPQVMRAQQEPVEHLAESPWVKFRPHSQVRSVSHRGTDFVYDWTTDRFGFKNSPDVARRDSVVAVAIGDSFVEGMGVPTDSTWASRLTRDGFATYSLGVQGYAPTQAVGSLKMYGDKFRHEWVLFGYTPGFEERSLVLARNMKTGSDTGFTGGVESIRAYSQEIRQRQHAVIVNAILDLAKEVTYSTVARLRFGEQSAAGLSDVKEKSALVFHSEDRAYQMALESIAEANRLARQQGAQLAVVLFPSRGFAYYPLLFHAAAPSSHYEWALAAALAKYCSANKIAFVDLHPSIVSYMKNRSFSAGDSLPYFALDGHMNSLGNRLVAEEVKHLFAHSPSRP